MAAREPIFNLRETFVLTLSSVLAGIWLLSVLLPRGLLYELDRFTVLQPLDATTGAEFLALIGYGLRHVSFGHLALNIIGLLWFGTLTLRGLRARAVREGGKDVRVGLLVVLAAGIVLGGIAQWAWWAATSDTQQEMVGASAGISATLATAVYAVGGRIVMLRFGVVWAVLNLAIFAFPSLAFSLGVVGGNDGWPAHLGGYLAGMGLASRLVTPRAAANR